MKQCRLCGKTLKEEETICPFCGYNIVTDSVSRSFQPKPESARNKEEREQAAKAGGVSPGVKKFALAGLAILIFSIFYKYNFNINTITSKANQLFNRIKTGEFTKGKDNKKADKEVKKVELVNVRSFDRYKKPAANKDLKVEGIFFDANAKSFIIINGKLICEGESFKNITVKKIYKDSVELIVAGKTETLKVNQSIPFSGK